MTYTTLISEIEGPSWTQTQRTRCHPQRNCGIGATHATHGVNPTALQQTSNEYIEQCNGLIHKLRCTTMSGLDAVKEDERARHQDGIE